MRKIRNTVFPCLRYPFLQLKPLYFWTNEYSLCFAPRMYEAKKQAAEKTIEKKDAKLKEINNILAEEINPTLSKLKEERSAYLGTPLPCLAAR